MADAQISGRITPPGSNRAVMCEVRAIPQTVGEAVPLGDRYALGPTEPVITGTDGTFIALTIPIVTGVLWRIQAKPVADAQVHDTWDVGVFDITGSTSLHALQPIPDVTAVSASSLVSVSEQADRAEAGAEQAATSASAAQLAKQQAQDLVLADLGTTDGQTRALIDDPNSQVAKGLSATVAPLVETGVSAGIGGARVLFEGTSIMHGRDENTASMSQRWDSPPLHAMLAGDGRWRYIGNRAVDGSTSAAVLARVDAAIAEQPNIIVSDTGLTNDGGISITQWIANVIAWVDAVRAAGILPVLCTPCPNVPSRARLARGRTWLIRYCSAQAIPLVDWHEALGDPATGGFNVATENNDGVHPVSKGRQRLGIAIDKVLRQVVRPAPAPLVDIVNDPGDLLGGRGLFIASQANGGTLPFQGDGWQNNVGYDPAITWTTPPAPKGYAMQASVGPGAVQPAQIYRDFTTGFAAGDRLAFSGRFATPDGGQAPQLGVIYFDAGYSNVLRQALAVRGTVGPDQAVDGVFSQESVVPAGTAVVRIQLFLANATGQTVTRVSQVGLRNLTADTVL